MINTLQFKESGHLDPALTDPSTRTLNADKLLGGWRNTNAATQGIAAIVIERNEDEFDVNLLAIGAEGPIAWPRVRAKAFANLEEEAGQRAVALAATFEFGFMTAEAYLRVNKGVLVIVLYVTFRDNSGRSNYVNREFYYRLD